MLEQAREIFEQLPGDRKAKVAELASSHELSLSAAGEPEQAQDARRLIRKGQKDEDKSPPFTPAPRLYAPGRLLFLRRAPGE